MSKQIWEQGAQGLGWQTDLKHVWSETLSIRLCIQIQKNNSSAVIIHLCCVVWWENAESTPGREKHVGLFLTNNAHF